MDPRLRGLEKVVQDTINWCEFRLKDQLRPDLALHIAEAVMHKLDEESGLLAQHHAAGRYWNGSSGQYDEGGCW